LLIDFLLFLAVGQKVKTPRESAAFSFLRLASPPSSGVPPWADARRGVRFTAAALCRVARAAHYTCAVRARSDPMSVRPSACVPVTRPGRTGARCAAPSVIRRSASLLLHFVVSFVLLLAGARTVQATPFEEVRDAYQPSEAVLLDRDGRVLHELRVDDRIRRLPWVPLERISPAVVAAVLHAEDRRFFEHGGVDWRALGDAAIDTLIRGAPRGASTVTMQLAAMLDPALVAEGPRRSVVQKVRQIRAAQTIERTWTKRQILEAYLNLSTFRGEVTGIGAASEALFRKEPAGLDLREGAILAALLRGPNAQPPVVAKRACAVAAGSNCAPFSAVAEAALAAPPRLTGRPALAPHLARALLSREARRVTTTLDAGLQAKVLESLAQQLTVLAGRHVRDAAAIVLDNATGQILAYAGNGPGGGTAPYVDGVRALRQAGSTLKPFLYAQAIEDRLLSAASLLCDSSANLLTPAGLHVPQNYDHEFRGPVSVRTALSSSLNVPAVRALMLVGPETFVERLRALGFEGLVESGDHYGYSLALGSAEVTLLQLANAFRTLANGGVASPVRALPGPAGKAVRTMDPAAAWIVADILADRGARSAGFGFENPLATRFWSAVKTGTSKDMRDNWCVGFSRRYTVGVWVGNFDGSPMQDVSGISGAAPAWLDIMQALHAQDAKAGAPARPADVVAQRVRFIPETEPERDEWFVRGTEVAEVVLKGPRSGVGRILYPGDGVILAIDPDIPETVQRVLFRSESAPPDAQWWLDGTALADGGPVVRWVPRPGRFELALVAADGAVMDRVRFEVRGTRRTAAP